MTPNTARVPQLPVYVFSLSINQNLELDDLKFVYINCIILCDVNYDNNQLSGPTTYSTLSPVDNFYPFFKTTIYINKFLPAYFAYGS